MGVKARDAIATPAHGAWGSVRIAYGILSVLLATDVSTPPSAAVLASLAAGSGILAGAYIYGSHTWVVVARWVRAATGRTILPLGKYEKEANVPGGKPIRPIELEWVEPGMKMGQ